MSQKDFETRGMHFGKEVEAPLDMDTSQTADSVKAFAEHGSGMEEMEYYDEEQEIVHRKGNSGVIPNLEFLPTDSIRMPQISDDDLGMTKVMPSKSASDAKGNSSDDFDIDAFPEIEYESEDDIVDGVSEALALSEYGSDEEEYDDGEYDDSEDEEYDEEDEYDDEYEDDEQAREERRQEKLRKKEQAKEEKKQRAEEKEKAKEEKRQKAEEKEKAREEKEKLKEEKEKAGEFIAGAVAAVESASEEDALIRPDDGWDDDFPLLPEDVEELEDLSYHNEDVKVPKKKKTEAHASDDHHENNPAGKDGGKAAPKGKKKKGFGLVDGLVIGGAVAAVLAICILGVLFFTKNVATSTESYTEIGKKLASIDGVGDAAITEIIANKTTTVVESESEDNSEETSESKKAGEEVSVNFSSVEKDLKIKFSNKTTDALITGVLFKVEAKTPDNKTVTWEDTDKDGMIYEDNLTPGTYYVRIEDVGDYKFPAKDTEVTVKDKVSYTAINVVNEIKKEKDINVATEDTAAKIVDTGEKLQDTVAWVESTTKTVYTEISKDKVTEPQASLSVSQKSFSAVPTLRGPYDTSALFDAENCITGLSLSESSITLTQGGSTIIIANVEGKGDVDMGISWSSSDSSVATVEGGEIKGIKVGSATITCTTNGKDADGNSLSRSCAVTVVDAPQAVTNVTLNKTSVVLGVGASDKLTATVEGGGSVDKSVTYSSSDSNIATVSADGTITAKAVGNATITCTTNATKIDGSQATATCSVLVQATAGYVTSLTLDKTTASVAKGAKLKLTPTIQTDGTGADMTVTWNSSAANIASVAADGTITGVENGTAVISCVTNGRTSDGRQLSATCTVTVKTASTDTTSNLTYVKDGETKQLYVKDGDNYREAKYADYYKYSVFYLKEEIYTGWQTINGVTRYYDANGKYVTGEQVIGGVKYNFANDGGISMGSGTMGIDVSKWNGNINWTAVKNAGVNFVIIRCGYRGSTQGSLIEDSNFHTNASGAEANGIKVGVYFFSQAINEREAVEEASMAISMAQKHKVSYPIFIDIEFGNNTHTARADGLNKEQRTAVARAFCETIRSSGYTPGVYSSKSWFYSQMDVSQLNQYKIWLAHYISKTDYKYKFDLWQSSSTGRINGINGNVDIDTSYLGY